MAEIADMIINGDFDCETGEYIGEGQGFPRTTKKTRNRVTDWQGVKHYLQKFDVKKGQDCVEVTLRFAKESGIKEKDMQKLSKIIQSDFAYFGTWCHRNLKRK